MVDIRITQLPSGTPTQTKLIAMDLASTEKATVKDIVFAGRPTASQAEAVAGVDNEKAMTSLTTSQALAAATGSTIQPQSDNLTTLSGIVPGAAGTSILGYSIAADVRDFLDTAPYVSTRTTLKALNVSKDTTAILTEVGRDGVFIWRTGDYSALVAQDTAESTYVKANSTSASVGAWVRQEIPVRRTLRSFGAVGNGTTDDTAAINAALAAGVPLTGSKRTYAVTGKISLLSGNDIEDIEFKQLAPGASLNVITLEANAVDNVRVVRVKVNRNGDGTNGGLLNASGDNGALNSAFGMSFVSCTNSRFEDLEVYGNDSGTGIVFRQIGETSSIIRPYVHDMAWARTVAEDDQVQGIWFDRCTRCPVEAPRAINLTGTLNGVASRRFTRGIVSGASVGLTIIAPYVEKTDQGVDITGGSGGPNREVTVRDGVARDVWTWGFKLANTARRCNMVMCRTYDCGVGFVASANSTLSNTITTDRSNFIDCVAYNTGSNGQTVVSIAGFRVLESAATPAGRATNIRFVRCRAIDEQAVKTMPYGFASELTDISVAPMLLDCESIGHTLGKQLGLFRTNISAIGTVSQVSGYPTGDLLESGSTANGLYLKFIDGSFFCWANIDATSFAITTARGSFFGLSTSQLWTYPGGPFAAPPVVQATLARDDTNFIGGASIAGIGQSAVSYNLFSAASLASGATKYVLLVAKGRWY